MSVRFEKIIDLPKETPHLSLVEDDGIEYDEDFMGESGFPIRIIRQGNKVVANRKALFERMAVLASSELKPEEV